MAVSPRRQGASPTGPASPKGVVGFIRHLLTRLGVFTASPWAFGIVSIYGVLWWVFDRETLNWHGFAVLATWLMTLLIQRAEHRDTQAIHAKLDELLHAESDARNRLTKVDQEEPEVIEGHRNQARRGD
jgi:low affinity Fe/Cu permease